MSTVGCCAGGAIVVYNEAGQVGFRLPQGPHAPPRRFPRRRAAPFGGLAGAGLVRSEEQLRVGTEQAEAGRVRLHKYVVTEQQQVTVPVRHEEVRIEQQPVRDGETGRIGEDDREVVLHAERPVVETEAVPVEKVQLRTETVTEARTVSG